jgi:NADPH:quinone reductase-like Zn-dependent oxidoreductase
MKAMTIHHYGNPDAFQLEDLPVPQPAAGEVRVKVQAVSINPVDLAIRQGIFMQYELPAVVGWDLAGTVEALGEGVSRFKIGDEVFGMVRFPKPGRAYAAFVTAPETDLALKPPGMSMAQAAATTLAALTAEQALELMDLKAGQTLLIHAAVGGVGHFAVQLAKARGARVIGTASGKNREVALALGVDQFIDYTTERFEDAVGQVDAVFDCVGGETFTRSYAVLRPEGHLVTIAATPNPTTAPRSDIFAQTFLVAPNHTQLERFAQLFENGQLVPHISQVFPLERVADAHRAQETKRTVGKIVLEVGSRTLFGSVAPLR